MPAEAYEVAVEEWRQAMGQWKTAFTEWHTSEAVVAAIRERIDGLLSDHGVSADATDFKGEHLLECAVTELRWCLAQFERKSD